MKTFDEIRIDLVKIAEKIDSVCKAHRPNCENCPLLIKEPRFDGRPFEYDCAYALLDNDLNYYGDNVNDIAGYFRPEE